MYSETVVIVNETGLHARPAHKFVNRAKQFKSEVLIRHADGREEEAVTAKSILLLLSLGFCKGDSIEITAHGQDEKQAVKSLVELLAAGFGED